LHQIQNFSYFAVFIAIERQYRRPSGINKAEHCKDLSNGIRTSQACSRLAKGLFGRITVVHMSGDLLDKLISNVSDSSES
jgi:hypothetical protein